MGWSNDALDSLLLPSGATIPGDAAWHLTTDLPAELQTEGITAAIIGYVPSFDPDDPTRQVVYFFHSVRGQFANISGSRNGWVIEESGVREVFFGWTENFLPNPTADFVTFYLRSVAAGAADDPDTYVEFQGSRWDPAREMLTPFNALYASARGYGVWRNCTVRNGWTNRTDATNSAPAISVLRDSVGTVHLRGLLNVGTTTAFTKVADLPTDLLGSSSYAPNYGVNFRAQTANAGGDCGFIVRPDGGIYLDNVAAVPVTYTWIFATWSNADH